MPVTSSAMMRKPATAATPAMGGISTGARSAPKPFTILDTSVAAPMPLRSNKAANSIAMRRTKRLRPTRHARTGGHGSLTGHHGGGPRRLCRYRIMTQ
ncbi:MAG TPA: hypothetical protein VG222_09830 [Vicinamibacterales bacterium]|nr:hypothetical protein [Vicinamibacterales bacterium]